MSPVERPQESPFGGEWRADWEPEISEQEQPRAQEPEISEQRKAELVSLQSFAGQRLSRADIEWLLHRGNSNFAAADLRGADLQEIDLRKAHLERANLQGAILRGARLEGADLREVDLEGADLQRADLRGAILELGKLQGANLEGANLLAADLHDADLRKAHLLGANLQEATLRGARLEGADLRLTRLEYAVGLSQEQIDSAITDLSKESAVPQPEPVAESSVLPRYRSDSPEGDDLLDVRPEVEALAKVLAAHKTEPPLSIGLFADWGGGKSFFMNMLREEIERLAQASQGSVESAFCANVVQIQFNAWHYVEADLWASLVTNVFEELHRSLAAQVGGDPGGLLQKLEIFKQEEINLLQAQASLEAAEQKVADLTLQSVAEKQGELQKDVESFASAFGRPPEEVNVVEVLQLADETKRRGLSLRRAFARVGHRASLSVLLTVALMVAIAGFVGLGVFKTPLALQLTAPLVPALPLTD